MQFTTVTALLAAAAVVSALPTDQTKQQAGGLQCTKGSGGEWNWGWSNNEEDQNYNCESSGLLNLLTCVSVLDGSNLSIPIDILGAGLL